MILAINQPYFSPYSGYFSLINTADMFVIYDSVQFIRRGRIHRAQLHESPNFSAGWLTLPIEKAPRETLIADMMMRPLSEVNYSSTDLKLIQILGAEVNIDTCQTQMYPLADFLEEHLSCALKRLSITTKIIRSSQLSIAPDLHGQDRILAICRQLGATEYLNLPGGRDLYDTESFEAMGIGLKFLNTSSCTRTGYLQALAENDIAQFSEEAHRDLR